MKLEEILRHCDHTLLRTTAVWEEIRQIVEVRRGAGEDLHGHRLSERL